MRLTKEQQKALKAKWEISSVRDYTKDQYRNPIHYTSYRAMRRSVMPELCNDGAAMVLWCGMWLGIEKDGYTHS